MVSKLTFASPDPVLKGPDPAGFSVPPGTQVLAALQAGSQVKAPSC